MKALLLVCLCLPFPFCHAADKNWDYYRTILESGLFPERPTISHPVEPERTTLPPFDRWEINYRVNMVYHHVGTGKTMVGLQNIKGPSGRPLNYILEVGERHVAEQILLREVVHEGETTFIELEKAGKSANFKLHQGLRGPAKTSTQGLK